MGKCLILTTISRYGHMANNLTMIHSFSLTIINILESFFGENANYIFEHSPLIGYLNIKTKSAEKGSKARGAFANHYALYVVIEDYINKGYADKPISDDYSNYEGAKFTDLFKRQRQLPFGAKLQNHALNDRLNSEFKKFYPTLGKNPIVRDVERQRYWIQEDLLKITVRDKKGIDSEINIAKAIIKIIDEYVNTKKAAFESFIDVCKKIASIGENNKDDAIAFIKEQLQPNVDARVFEIVSYAVLKAKYGKQTIWIGDSKEDISEEFLILYKTGRTNANDGGIDFVMKPLGRFFQVTETIDASKYFLDIDKVQKFPITFVVKTEESSEQIRESIKAQAIAKYRINQIVDSYMNSVEEIINVPDLIEHFNKIIESNSLNEVMSEIIIQSKVEFNYTDEEEPTDDML